MTHSLLDEPVFRIRTRTRESQKLSLPELLAAYSADRVDSLVALRPHQEAMFHSFMVSLAFMAMDLAGEPSPSTDTARWRELLRGLTHAFPGDEPWHLLIEDVTTPAFMQSPCGAAEAGQYTGVSRSPQELDVLVASKSHDIKPGKFGGFGVEQLELWVFALVSLHADAAYMGRGNYGSMRKNGGYATRSHFRLAFDRGLGAEFARDLRALMERHEALTEEAGRLGVGLHAGLAPQSRLLWLAEWSASAPAVQLKDVHPLCLEVARRVRLALEGDAVVARTASSKAPRVAAEEASGVVGDPWAPVVRESKGDKAFNPQTQTGGFSYRRLAPVLFDREAFTLPLLARPARSEMSKGGTMVARALGRAQGGTDGYLSREVHFPPAAMRRTVDAAAHLALRSQSFDSWLADMCARSGDNDAALSIVEKSLAGINDVTGRSWESELYRRKAQFLLALHPKRERDAELNLRKAIDVARLQNAKSFELRAVTGLASLWISQNRSDEARDLIEPVYDWFSEGRNTEDLRRAREVRMAASGSGIPG